MKRTALLRKSDPTSRASVPVYRPKRCKACPETFTPQRAMQVVCGPQCAVKWGFKVNAKEVEKAAKAEKRADKAKRESLKTRSDHMKEAQHAFNAFIRTRDAARPCICCGEPLGLGSVGGYFDCGHYRSVGSAPHLRFDERNAHGQRKQCNRYGSGRAVDYRKGLIARVGLAVVEELECDQAPRHLSVDDLKAIKTKYRALARQLEKQ